MDITRKDMFRLAIYFKWKYFGLTDHVLSETICLFCFCILFPNIYPKIKFKAKHWSDLYNFYSKVFFFFFFFVFFVQENIFLLFFAEFKLLMLPNNIVKI